MIVVDWASVLVALCGVCASATLSIIAIVVAYFSAKRFGDVAGQKAAQEYEEKRAATARLLALRALLNEVEVIREIALSNTQAIDPNVRDIRGFSHLPVHVFETAFSTNGVLVDADRELIQPVTEYLAFARHTNALIDLYLSMASTLNNTKSWARHAIGLVVSECEQLTPALDSIEKHLRKVLSD